MDDQKLVEESLYPTIPSAPLVEDVHMYGEEDESNTDNITYKSSVFKDDTFDIIDDTMLYRIPLPKNTGIAQYPNVGGKNVLKEIHEANHSLEWCHKSCMDWKWLIDNGAKKWHFTRENGWFDPTKLNTLFSVTVDDLIKDLEFNIGDLISRKIKPVELRYLKCGIDTLIDKLGMTPLDFAVLSLDFSSLVKHGCITEDSMYKLIMLPGNDIEPFLDYLIDYHGMTSERIKEYFPGFFTRTDLDISVITKLKK